jgi:hypothetical protein
MSVFNMGNATRLAARATKRRAGGRLSQSAVIGTMTENRIAGFLQDLSEVQYAPG